MNDAFLPRDCYPVAAHLLNVIGTYNTTIYFRYHFAYEIFSRSLSIRRGYVQPTFVILRKALIISVGALTRYNDLTRLVICSSLLPVYWKTRHLPPQITKI